MGVIVLGGTIHFCLQFLKKLSCEQVKACSVTVLIPVRDYCIFF